jgi:glucose/mannose-6-phosphate isomerase
MSIYEAIKNFHKQFEWKPAVENSGKLGKYSKFIVAGMGGSNLAADLLKIRKPDLDITTHRDYGLPLLPKSASKDTLVIASSYSGNTEETISAFKEAIKKKIPVAVVSIGGKLLELAKKYKKPFVQMPDLGIQPRSAIGFNIKADLALMSERVMLREIGNLSKLLKPHELERAGKALAEKLLGHTPVIYSSVRNFGIAYNWKVKFNETGKIPAFINLFSEINHNEMTGFDVQGSTRELSRNFHFVFLKDVNDNPKIVKRMNITERLYRERGLPVEVVMLSGKDYFHKIFSSLVFADWASYYTALEYGVDPEQVPMVEEFKKLIK